MFNLVFKKKKNTYFDYSKHNFEDVLEATPVRARAASNCSVGSSSVDGKLTRRRQTSVYDLLQRRVVVPRKQLPDGRRKENADTWSEFHI